MEYDRTTARIMEGKPGRPRRRWEDNMNTVLLEMGWESILWMEFDLSYFVMNE